MAGPTALQTVHLSTAHTWRGGENQLFLLAKGLLERGHGVLVLAPKDAPLLERAREAHVPCRVLGLRGELDPAGTWRLARILREVRPAILHLHDGHAVLPGQFAARALRRRELAVIAHRRTAFRLRGRWKYAGRVDKVIAISQAAREQVLAGGVPADRVAVVYSGLVFPEPLPEDGPEARALRQELRLPEGAFLAAHAAALTAEKRQEDLIAALALMKDDGRPSVHLALAGGGEREAALRSEAARRGVAGRVHFLGFRRDLRPLWAAAGAAVFASEAEGLCTALIEAQGAGLPGVITRAGGMTEVVEDGVTGTSVAVGDVPALARALAALAGNDALRKRMGRAARERARRLFSAAAMVEGTLCVYREARAGALRHEALPTAGAAP